VVVLRAPRDGLPLQLREGHDDIEHRPAHGHVGVEFFTFCLLQIGQSAFYQEDRPADPLADASGRCGEFLFFCT
jgi:hypothetical protein